MVFAKGSFSRTSSRPRRRRTGLEMMELEDRRLLTLLGQSLFPADNPWNQNISAAPVAANSTAVINNIVSKYGPSALHPDFAQDYGTHTGLYGIPYNVGHGKTAAPVSVVIDSMASESDLISAPIPSNAVLEGDFQDGPNFEVANRGDSHLIVYDVDNNVAYEFYHASRPSENADGRWHADSEAVWNMKTDTFRTLGYTSADAAGLSILAGLTRPDEGLPVSQGGQGVINHAIRFTLPNAVVLNQYTYPASHSANPGNTNASIQVPLGSRFRLKASVDISGLDPQSKIIAQAMKTYGMILADNGSANFVSGSSYSVDANNNVALTWNDSDIQDRTNGLKSLPESDFELVNLQPVVTRLTAASGPAGTTLTVTGQNFSGAAGHLQVLFGSTAATSVSILDDSHLAVQVPTGTGTVDVRVQSGITVGATPNDFNSPIFGYGTSAVSAADRFTYTAAPASDLLSLTAPATDVAGTAFSLTVTARGSGGSADAAYTGTVRFAATDAQAGLPASYTFTAADAGSHTFAVTLKTAGAQTVSAADVAAPAIAGTSPAIAVAAASARTLSVAGAASATAGAAYGFIVTARDAYGNVATGFADPVAFSSSNARNALPAAYTFTPADAGTHAFSATLVVAGAGQSVTVLDASAGIGGIQAGINVSPAAVAGFVVSRPSASVVAGASAPYVVTAVDAFGNTVTNYAGTLLLTSGDPQVPSIARYTFTAADAGSHTFAVALKTAGVQAVSAADASAPSLSGSCSIAVTAAAASTLAVVGAPPTVSAGVPVGVVVTARDAYGNKATGYAGTVGFLSSDAQAGLPASYTFTAADAGTHAFSVTLKTAGAQSVSATDASAPALSGSCSIAVIAAATGDVLSLTAPPTDVAGTAIALTVTAKNSGGSTDAAYTGTVRFAATDAQAGLPASYTFTAADAGSHTFAVTLKTAGVQTVSAADAAAPAIAGTSPAIAVAAAAFQALSVVGSGSTTAGVAYNFTVTARDAYGNVVAGYSDPVSFAGGYWLNKVPAPYTFTAADAGTHTFSATLVFAGANQSIYATDAKNLRGGVEAGITVSPAAMVGFSVQRPSAPVVAGVTAPIVVTAVDAYSNAVTSYLGTVLLKSFNPQVQLLATYTFTPADAGTHTLNVALTTAGTPAVMAYDSVTSTLSGGTYIGVTPAAATTLVVTGVPSSAAAGTAYTVTVTARDAYGNKATGYLGAIAFASGDARAILPAAYLFTAADAGSHTFTLTFKTTGPQWLTATDTANPSITWIATGIVVSLIRDRSRPALHFRRSRNGNGHRA